MTLRSRAVLAFIVALLPLTIVCAAAPSAVTGIKGTKEGNGVRVMWNPVTGQTISAYRVFYSHASILAQNGAYDDFETAAGNATSYLLQNVPTGDTVYVSVLAVNDKNEESPVFQEEAMVALRAPTAPTGSTAPVSGTMKVLKAEATTPTSVVVTFSDQVVVPADKAAAAFTILANGGLTQLPATRLTIQANTVKIDTQMQERNGAYLVKVNPAVVVGKDAAGKDITLDTANSTALFSGHPSGQAQQQVTPQPTAPTASLPADVLDLRLRAQAEQDGRYAILATWQSPTDPAVTALQIFQTMDGGRTYSQPVAVTPTTTSVNIPHVPAGTFGVLVRSVGNNQATSRGIMQLITLPSTNALPATVTPTVPQTIITPPKQTHLPNSGPQLILVGLAAGFTGLLRYHSRKRGEQD